MLSMAALALQWRSWLVATENILTTKLKIFTIVLLQKKFADPHLGEWVLGTQSNVRNQ